jgi:lipopolysaccharide transport system ATP-binding protein
MSSDISIKVDGLSKCYQIYDRPQDRLKQSLFTRLQRIEGLPIKNYYKEFWALKDVSFQVQRGETLGIIGRNGSGKSTLLQLICGTLNPTLGGVQTHGRIAALLELGSGFNPEFTGRENVFLNAALLGLSGREIEERYESILRFADIGDFINQPVKVYSSGMLVRLAFAVIAHVEADVLIVDEALAVGDAVFTQKCMRFIRKFQERGSLLFVSHDIASVQNLCKSAIWLHEGKVALAGSAKKVAEAYLQFTMQEISGDELQLTSLTTNNKAEEFEKIDLDIESENLHDYSVQAHSKDNMALASGWKTGKAEILSVTLVDKKTNNEAVYEGGELLRMVIKAKANECLTKPILGFLVRDRLGQDLFGENTVSFTKLNPVEIGPGTCFEANFEFRLPMLPNGQYVVMASVADGDYIDNVQHHWMHDALIINVFSSKVRYGLVGIPFSKVELISCE